MDREQWVEKKEWSRFAGVYLTCFCSQSTRAAGSLVRKMDLPTSLLTRLLFVSDAILRLTSTLGDSWVSMRFENVAQLAVLLTFVCASVQRNPTRLGPPNIPEPTKSRPVSLASLWCGDRGLMGPALHRPNFTDFTRIAKKYNLDAFTTYNAEVEALTWSEERQAWKIDLQTPEGPKSDWTHVVINSAGFINNVKDFKFEGEDLFKGKCMHTARFDRSVDVKGKKVAVIGNGSSGGF